MPPMQRPETIEISNGERLGRMTEKIDHLERKVEELDRKLDELVAMAHRWKGALALMLGIGSLIGWVISILPKLK